MSNNKHSWFPPSAAARSIRCPASIQAIESLACVDAGNNHAANLGTECHEAMELSLIMGEPMWDDHPFTEPKEQKELCEIAWKALNSFFDTHHPEVIIPETQVDLSEYGYEDIFGTADVITWIPATRTVAVIDYKFGYNEVLPENNEQLMIYGLGAMKRYPDAENVMLVVIQPKVSNDCRSWLTTIEDLEAWFTGTLEPAIDAAKSANPVFQAGEVQCKYCPVAKSGCKYQTQQYLDALDIAPKEAFELADDKLTRLLVMIPAIQDAIKAVEVAAIERMKKGRKLDGYKLVERQTKRKWADADKTLAWLKTKRFKLADITKNTLQSPAQIEKLVAKKRFKAEVLQEFKDMINKPEGSLTYAVEHDKRKAVEINETAALSEDILDDIL